MLWRWLFALPRSRIHGAARFLSSREMRRYFSPENSGIVLSSRYRLSLADSCANCCVFAPTGMGKTTSFVIPNLLRVRDASVVVTDPSGEIFRHTSGYLQDQGFAVEVFRPGSPHLSAGFNPCRQATSPERRMYLARCLGNGCGDSDAIWRESAQHIMYVGLSALAAMPDETSYHPANLRWLLNHFSGAPAKKTDRLMARYLGAQNPQLFQEYMAFRGKDDRFTGSVLATALSCLNQWLDPGICSLTATSTLDLDILRKRPTVLYLVVPEHKIPYYATILNLLYSAAFDTCLEVDGIPVFFFLDEFGNLGKIENFATMATTLRKRKCSLNLILQDVSQLEHIYGVYGARTILRGGTQHRLFFGGLDVAVARDIAARLGARTEYDTVFGGMDPQARTVEVPLMRAEDICQLGHQEVLLLSGNRRPVKARMQAWYEVKELRQRANMKPCIPVSRRVDPVRYVDFG